MPALLRYCGAMLLLCIPGSAALGQTHWQSDPSASELNFVAYYENEALHGRFGVFEVRLSSRKNGSITGTLSVNVELTSIDMNDREINEELAETDWFDTASFPTAHFEAENFRQLRTGHYIASGTLDLKGVVRELDVPFDWEDKSGEKVMTGQVELSRQAWKVGAGDWADDDRIADDVQLNFRVVLRRMD